ncbi:MAG: glycoside hydrolase family 43 protein [Treponema sp.]|nr:glycoside hydrolase family 43 protein [Treponema sp.]
MKYQNPVLRGMYPDPSVCRAGDKFYMVTSTFHFFPGVPLFESDDMITWHQIGHVLTRKSQLLLGDIGASGGIYAPNIRYHNGRFYMVVTNVSNIGNFYVWTDDIYGEWSDPICVEQSGIDPTLFFDDDGKTYFVSNGNDENGVGYIQISEIDIETGKKLSENKPLWYGTGGRYIEAPHVYKFGEYYYVLDAEGGTEYGHMVNYARSKNLMGPYEPCPANPVLTNRDMGGYQLQGAGHGDIVEAPDGTWWFCHLAFRQIDRYMPFHHLGRETCVQPVYWKDGWFYIGTEGQALLETEVETCHKIGTQDFSYEKTFENLTLKNDWNYLRNPVFENYRVNNDSVELKSTEITLNEAKSPTWIGVRACEFEEDVSVQVVCGGGEAGLSIMMDENHHYEIFVQNDNGKCSANLRLRIGPCDYIKKSIPLKSNCATLRILSNNYSYTFYADDECLGSADTRYLSSEVACGFTGVYNGLYAVGKGEWSKFTELKIKHS